jgi:ankyrin repeat protein
MKCDRFRWVVCQLDTLRRSMPSSIRKALDELPITLYETYERILEEITREKKEHTHRLFQCLISSVRPLRVEELGEILTFNFDTNTTPNLVGGWRPEHPEDEILCACSTLIAVVDDGDFRIVQFSHFSVKEFLISDYLRTSDVESIRHYYIPLKAAHTVLVRACLAVLLQLDETIDKNRLSMFPLASYAAQHWVGHAKFEDVALQITDAMERLFNPKKPYLASWAWIHDIDSPWVSRSIDALTDVPSPPTITALYYAALCGFAGLAKRLIILHEEDVNAKCGRHETPLHVAAHMGHVDAARVLLDHGADVDTNAFGETPLRSAYLTGHLDVMQLLLECGANPEVGNDDGWLLSHSASFQGKIDVMRLLLCHNASVNPKDKRKWTPLHCASRGGHGELVRFLLEHGADVNARDDKDSTPLCWAATDGNAEVVKHLLMYGADVDAIDDTNSTPLHWACTDGHVEVVKFLLEHGADVNVRDDNNSTPLRCASADGHVELVDLLLKHGADVDA